MDVFNNGTSYNRQIPTADKGVLLATPNYQFEKRQRDLAKKAKQEEKRRQKLAGKAAADQPASPPDEATPAVVPSGS